MNHRKRRFLVAYSKQQLQLISIVIVTAVLYAATNWVVSREILRETSDAILRLGLPDVTRTDVSILLQQQHGTLNLQMCILTFMSFLCILVGSMYLTHKLVGPIHRLNRYLRAVVRGDVQPEELHFRRDDFFTDLVAPLNDFQKKYGILPGKQEPEAPKER